MTVMLKRLLIFLAGCILLMACNAHSDILHENYYADGTFFGVGDGRGGEIVVAVTIERHAIAGIRVVSQAESKFAIPCEEQIIAKVLERQSLDGVDAVSGATLTSDGIMAAI